VARPTSIRRFLADSSPDGIRIVEKSNWTGRAVVATGTQLPDALQRDKLARPDMYVLAGTSDVTTASHGSSSVKPTHSAPRSRTQASRTDFWTWFHTPAPPTSISGQKGAPALRDGEHGKRDLGPRSPPFVLRDRPGREGDVATLGEGGPR
jgi:hypothetical protein